MVERKYIVYCHTLKCDGRKYIGITSRSPKLRWHRGSGYINNKYFYNAICKYGWDNFEHIILFDNLTKEEAEKKEIDLIKQFNTLDSKNGFNLREGGDTTTLSESTRKKISEKNRGRIVSQETRKKISYANSGINNGNYGKHYTQEEKEKMVRRGKDHWGYGKHLSQEHKNKIQKALKEKYDNGFVNPMKNKKQSQEHLQKLSKARKGLLVGNRNAKSKSIKQYDIDGKLIATYDSMRIASIQSNINYSCIRDCARGRQKTAGNYKWVLNG